MWRWSEYHEGSPPSPRLPLSKVASRILFAASRTLMKESGSECEPEEGTDALARKLYDEAVDSKVRNEGEVPTILRSCHEFIASIPEDEDVPRQVRTEAMESKARNHASVLPVNLRASNGALPKTSIKPISLTESPPISQDRQPTCSDSANCSLSPPVVIAQPVDAGGYWRIYRHDGATIEKKLIVFLVPSYPQKVVVSLY